ncbi:MAG: porin family protein [Amphritea sp.]|nr:porin family protein [Amphritea sp.]MBQ0784062.1 porin family protein [Amphritea sp.]
MKKTLQVSTAVAIIAISSSVFAQDWSGAYIGASIGHMDLQDKGTGYDVGGVPTRYTQTNSFDGSSIGLTAGYNWKLRDTTLFGLETEYQHREDNSGSTFQYYEGAIDTDYSLDTEINEVVSLRARMGELFNHNKTLAYVSAGLAAAKVKRTWIDSTTETHTSWQSGWTAGIGLEHMYNQHLSIRTDLRRTDFGKQTVAAELWSENYEQDLTENSFTLGLVYNF